MDANESIMDRMRLVLTHAGIDLDMMGSGWDAGEVNDFGIGIVEPGYGDRSTPWVAGNWNPARFPREGDEPLTKDERRGPRLAEALLDYVPNVEILWLDEWRTCDECLRVLRTEPDSYSWRMYGAWLDDGFYCAECLRDDVEWSVRDYVNDPTMAITWCDGSDLEAIGYQKYNGTFESGWYPGQTDDPKTVARDIEKWHGGDGGNLSIVFIVPSVGQFDIDFEAYFRVEEDEGP